MGRDDHEPAFRRRRTTRGITSGSAAGRAAAAAPPTAAGLVPGALGTDTGGSIRIPACLCGVTGVRPTTGRVSTTGVVPVSWTYDTVGPLARSAEDCALLLEAIAGHDPADPGSARVPVPRYTEELDGGIDGLRVGVVSHLLDDALVDPRVAAAAETRDRGARRARCAASRARMPRSCGARRWCSSS